MQKFGRLTVLFIVIHLFMFQLSTTGQNKKLFVITGKIVPEVATSENGIIEMSKSGTAPSKVEIPKNGRFRLELEYFNEYTLTFTLSGHFSKTITVSTDIPQEVWKRDNDFPPFPMIVQLFKEIEGIDKSFTLKPSGRIFYGKQTDNFEKESIFNDIQIAEQIATATAQSGQVKKEVQTITKEEAQELATRQKNFDQSVSEADVLYKRGEFPGAFSKYQEAQKLFPEKVYPNDRIAELQDLVKALELTEKQKAEIEQKYKSAIAKANGLFDQKTYKDARPAYQEALQYKPGDVYASGRMVEIDQLLALLEKQKQFDVLIAQADKSFNKKDYANAQADYRKSIVLKPEETYPANRIKEIDQILEKEQQAQVMDDNYKSILTRADKAFASETYADARKIYSEALAIKPNDAYPTGRITRIDEILAEKAKLQQTENEFLALVGKGDAAFDQKDYDTAKSNYTNALGMKPNSAEVKTKLKNIDTILQQLAQDKKKEEDRLMAVAAAQEKAYTDIIAQADKSFDKNDYVIAQADYRKSMTLKPDATYPAYRIKEIDQILEKEQKTKMLDDNFKSIVARADKSFKSESFDDARNIYTEALTVKPNEAYPTGQIAKIDEILAGKDKLKQTENEFLALVSKGDAAFDQKDYDTAKSNYTNALGMKPNSAEVKTKLKNIDTILLQLADNKKKEQDRLMALAAEKEKAYLDIIAQADKSFDKKDYLVAQADYRKSLTLKPDETYPANRIKEIDQIIEKEQQAKVQDDNYKSIVAKADKSFDSESYSNARNIYTEALTIKPNEAYPTGRITKIDEILAEKDKLQQTENEFLALVGKGDAAFGQKDYDTAKSTYTNALAMKPNSAEVKDKIKNIDTILLQLADNKKKEQDRLMALAAEKDKAYVDIIAQADKSFDKKDYLVAQTDYRKSMILKPDETYPANRIKEIDQILEKDQQAKVQDDNYKSIVAKADKSFDSESYSNARNIYTEALTIKPNEAYPTGRITKIDEILAEKAKLQQTESEFLALVIKGDAAFGQKDYDTAKSTYTNALAMKPNSAEVKAKIKNIDSILLQLAQDKKKEEDRLLALAAAQEKAYNEAIAKGNKLVEQKTYSDARVTFQEAKKLKPAELLPDQMIAKIDALIAGNERELAAARLKEEAYQKSILEAQESSFKEAMAKADKAFTENDFNTAKTGYQTALTIKGTDPTAKQKLGQTEVKLAELAKRTQDYNTAINSARQQAMKDSIIKVKDAAFNQVLSSAKELEQSKQYQSAILKYREAISLKPDEKEKVQKLIAAVEEKIRLAAIPQVVIQTEAVATAPVYNPVETEQDTKARAESYQTVNNYDEAISKADDSFGIKDYTVARFFYYKASDMKPNEEYPRNQIELIRKLVDSELSSVDRTGYEQAITQADAAFQKQNYSVAKFFYYKALGIKSWEKYPKDRIQEILALTNSLLSEKEEKDYRDLIARADEAYTVKDISVARFYYNKAMTIKKDEEYPRIKIKDIQKLIDQDKQDGYNLEYNKLLELADQAMQNKNYSIARFNYNKALSMKPNEKYPKDQLKRIKEALDK